MTSSWKLHLNAADEETPVKFCIRHKHIFFVYISIISYAEKNAVWTQWDWKWRIWVVWKTDAGEIMAHLPRPPLEQLIWSLKTCAIFHGTGSITGAWSHAPFIVQISGWINYEWMLFLGYLDAFVVGDSFWGSVNTNEPAIISTWRINS